jgi:AbrB family looped-hinge helix DNA binding protein
MYPITLSSRYRITIPRALREQLNLRPGRSTRYVRTL